MKLTYDKEADAVYIYLQSEIKPGEIKKTYSCDSREVEGIISLDFDKNGKLIGIEILGAKNKLPCELLKKISNIGFKIPKS